MAEERVQCKTCKEWFHPDDKEFEIGNYQTVQSLGICLDCGVEETEKAFMDTLLKLPRFNKMSMNSFEYKLLLLVNDLTKQPITRFELSSAIAEMSDQLCALCFSATGGDANKALIVFRELAKMGEMKFESIIAGKVLRS